MSNDIVKFHLGDIVYHAVDEDAAGMVTAIIYRDNGISYEVTWPCRCVDTHTAIELSYERQYHVGKRDE